MNFESTVNKIKKVVSNVERCTGKNMALPTLGYILITAREDKIYFKATNLSIGIEVVVSAKVEKEGVVLVRGDILSVFLSNGIGDEKVSLFQEKDLLIIKTKTNKATLKTFPHDDFPTLPQNKEDISTFEIPASALLSGFKSVFWSSGQTELKPEISGVYLYKEGDNIFFVATDSFRLAEKKVLLKKPFSFNPIIIPQKNVSEIIKIIEEDDGDICIEASKNQCSFSYKGTYITSRVISGLFPDYTQIIPREMSTEVVLLRQDLLNTLKLSNVFSDKFNQLEIKVTKNEFVVDTKNTDVGENYSELQAVIEGEPIVVKINQKYLIDVFQSITSDSFSISFSGIGKPIIIKGVSDPSFLYLIMPMNR